MGKKTGLFVSNDGLSEYVYRKLAGNCEVYPFSFSPVDFVDSAVFSFGDMAGLLLHFKKTGINKLVFIGSIPPRFLFKNEMHVSGKKFLNESGQPWHGERILSDLIAYLAKENIEVLPLTEVLCKELAEEKVYTDVPPDVSELSDIKIGTAMLKDLMKYRAGQSAAVKNGMIVAVEGIEGTNEMIKRAGMYCGSKGFTVVKIAGGNKDERFDLPVIGTETAEALKSAGGNVIAVEAGRTVILHKKETAAMCNESRIKLLGIRV
ncbi:MAG: UDP-2,3-diacylglucosamine diphosphatase LpxI [Candidatus Omnitrophica bacterium]|nr:UDP-2,3-diacylglucosamine diphosphatase LpxI [Candidatus Omnitrophota bacterium]